jgi:uncharacterized membrane protein YgcG
VDINRYAYAGNDPVNMADRNGHSGCCIQGISGGNFGNALWTENDTAAAINMAVDFTPVVGDIKGFIEAETPTDYLVAAVTLIPGTDLLKGLKKVPAREIREMGYDIHHVLPRGVANDPFLNDIGFDVDSAWNKIALPRDASMASQRTVHRGMHVREYGDQFKDLVNDLKQRVAKGELTKGEALDRLRDEIAKVRQRLRTNEERLNKASDSKPSSSTGSQNRGGGSGSGSSGGSGCSSGQRDRGGC